MILYNTLARHHAMLGKYLVGALLLFGIGAPLQAAEINLQQALQKTLTDNAELQLYPFILRQADALQLQAELRPVTKLTASLDNIAGSGNFSGTDSAEISLILSQNIELGDKRQKRLAVANASSQQQQQAFEVTRLDVLAETSRRYYKALEIQALLDLTQQRIAQENQALAIIRKRAQAGAVGQADVIKMELRLAQSQALAMQFGHQHQQQLSYLSAMWQSAPRFTRVQGALIKPLPQQPDRHTLLAQLQQAPAMAQLTGRQQLADAQLQLQEADNYRNIDIGVGLKQLEASGDQALTFNISSPLYINNPNRGRAALALVERNKQQQQAQSGIRQLELQLMQHYQQLNHHYQYTAQLQDQLLPKARELLSATEKGYQQGLYSVLQWVDAQAALFELQTAFIKQHSNIYQQLLELERLIGQPLLRADQGE